MALDGTVLHDIDVGAIDPNMYLHHDVRRTPGGNIAAIVSTIDTVDKSSVGGSANAPVMGQGVIEVDTNGSLVWDWSIFDFFDPLDSPGPGGYWTPKFGGQIIDWMHANSFTQNNSGDYYFSMRDEDHILAIDRGTGQPDWTCGVGGGIIILPPDSFFNPHSIRIAGDGDYILYDNDSQISHNRVIEWWIDWGYASPELMISWEFDVPSAYSSNDAGHAERIPGNRMLISSGEAGAVFEVANNGDLMWFAEQEDEMYRAYHVPRLYPAQSVAFVGDTSICLGMDSTVALEATQPGGFWSGNHVSNGIFDAAAAGSGTHSVSYKWGPTTLDVNLFVDTSAACIVAVDPALEHELELKAFPNPFTNEFQIEYQLPSKSAVTAELFSLDGRKVATIEAGMRSPGKHRVTVDGDKLNLPSGSYLFRIRTDRGQQDSRILVRTN